MSANANSIVQLAMQSKNAIIKHVNVTVKIITHAKKDYGWNPSRFICENSHYLKSIADSSVIVCGEIIDVMDIVSTKLTNTIATIISINCHS